MLVCCCAIVTRYGCGAGTSEWHDGSLPWTRNVATEECADRLVPLLVEGVC